MSEQKKFFIEQIVAMAEATTDISLLSLIYKLMKKSGVANA